MNGDFAMVSAEMLVRGGVVGLLSLWTMLLVRDWRTALPARMAAALNAAIIAYMLARPVRLAWPTSGVDALFDIASVMASPFFWLFAYCWFTDAPRIGWRRWLLTAAFAALPTAQWVLFAFTGQFDFTLWLMTRTGLIGFALAGVLHAWRGRDDDLVDARRRLRTILIWTIGLFVLWIGLVEVPGQPDGWVPVIRLATDFAILVATLVVSVALYRFAQPGLFAAPAPSAGDRADAPPVDPSPLAQRLMAHMTHDRPYRSEGLTIAALAAQLGEQEYRLRRLINGELGYRNFTAFLNSYRLAEVREALADQTQREVPILTMALDAGFGSLGPFNRAFRDAHGMTPSAYRAQHLADSEIG